MKVTVNRKNLLDALSIGAAQAGKCKTLPILECAKINIESPYIIVSSFDDECAVVKKEELISADSDGKFCVNASDFTKSLKSLKSEEVTFEVDDSIITIKHKRGEMKLPLSNYEEFPEVAKGDNPQSFTMKAEKLFSWINTSKSFVGNDDFRPVMKGMYWYIDGNEVGCAASDGMKLFSDCYFDDSINAKVSAIVSSNAFNTILSLINGHEDVNIYIDSINITFAVDEAKISCRLFDGRYPNFKSILPKDNNNVISINKKELQEMINRASLFADQSSALIVFDVKGMNLDITAEDIDFSKKSDESTIVRHDGEDIRIGLKANFILDCLQSVESEDVTIKMKSPSMAILVCDDNLPNKNELLMPMQIR